MRVLQVCAEMVPLLKTGGLADVCGALPAALQSVGCEVRTLLPGYDAVREGVQVSGTAIDCPAGPDRQPAVRVIPATLRATGHKVYVLESPAWFRRDGGPYLAADGTPWPDNALRFGALGRVAALLGLGLDSSWRPQLLHAHDWHAGLTPLYLRLLAAGRRPPASVFTIHNLAFQGVFPASAMAALGLPGSLFHMEGVEFHGQMSFMKAALVYSDALTTVSPRYAREITSPEQGCGLDGLLRARQAQLTGILNGVDYDIWNPATDALLPLRYDADSPQGKLAIRQRLGQALGLRERPQALLFGAVTRLSEQKGLQLLPPVLDALVAQGGQLVVLGSGDTAQEAALRAAMDRHPGDCVLCTGHDEPLAHQIMAASDVLLMPSRFEPCGLTQMYAMRYGTLPLVHAVGGLADTVTDCALENLADASATGFSFGDFTSQALAAAVRRAFALRQRPDDWAQVRRTAMAARFDWSRAARSYRDLYETLLNRHPDTASTPRAGASPVRSP